MTDENRNCIDKDYEYHPQGTWPLSRVALHAPDYTSAHEEQATATAQTLVDISPRVGATLPDSRRWRGARDQAESPTECGRYARTGRVVFFDFGAPQAFAIVGVLQDAILRSASHGLRGVFL